MILRGRSKRKKRAVAKRASVTTQEKTPGTEKSATSPQVNEARMSTYPVEHWRSCSWPEIKIALGEPRTEAVRMREMHWGFHGSRQDEGIGSQ